MPSQARLRLLSFETDFDSSVRDLDIDVRKQLVLKELLGYHADIICLQECDHKVFDPYYRPHLQAEGHDNNKRSVINRIRRIHRRLCTEKRHDERGRGHFCPPIAIRGTSVLVPRTPCLVCTQIAGHVRLHMNEVLNGELPTHLLPFHKMVAECKNMRTALKSVVTIGQVVLLKPIGKREKPLCVVNTHLISHSYGEHIRVFHVLNMLHEASVWGRSIEEDAQLVLVGDLNSSVDLVTGKVDGTLFLGNPKDAMVFLDAATLTMLRDGRLRKDHWEWEECQKFCWTKVMMFSIYSTVDSISFSAQMTPEDDVSRLYESGEEGEGDPVEGIDVEMPFELRTAMSRERFNVIRSIRSDGLLVVLGLETPYTNFTEGFKGLLDYVWYAPHFMDVERSIPIPSPERIGKPCPSEVYPSDHLAVISSI